MPATYPGAIKSFAVKTNFTEIIDSSHINAVQDEIVAMQTNLGTSIATSTSPVTSGTFVTTSQNWGSLGARLANIETGIVSDSHTQYAKNAGGSTIQPATAATLGLNIRAAASQSANLQAM